MKVNTGCKPGPFWVNHKYTIPSGRRQAQGLHAVLLNLYGTLEEVKCLQSFSRSSPRKKEKLISNNLRVHSELMLFYYCPLKIIL